MEGILMNRSELCIGAQMFTVREYMKTKEEFMDAMRKVKEIGYRYVQVSGAADAPSDIIARSVKETGLDVVITHMPPSRIIDDTDKLIEEHLSYGAKAIGLGAMHTSRDYDGIMKFCEVIAAPAENIAKAGLAFAYHNHRFEFERYSGKSGLEILLENTPDSVMLTLDSYWAVAGGADPVELIKKHKNRIFCTHLKDMTVINDAQTMTEVGTGNMNYAAIIDASVEAGIKYHFVEQDIVRMNAFDSLKISYDNIMAKYLL